MSLPNPRPKPRKPSPPPLLSSTSLHALHTELTAARLRRTTTPKSSSRGARARPPSKALHLGSNPGVSSRALKDQKTTDQKTTEDIGGDVSERQIARSRERLEQKARIYEALQRGDVDDGGDGDDGEEEGGLVDFTRKWAEGGGGGGSREVEGGREEMVEFVDEFGRTRVLPRSQADLERARPARGEGEGSAPKPPPEGLIYGNVIQTNAFQTSTFSSVPSAEMLQSVAPKDTDQAVRETHYDASKEVRTKGVGFYQFSKDEEERQAEFEALEKERKRTEEERERMLEKKRRRNEELAKRREEVRRKRRGKVGETWLEGFMGELQGTGGDVGGQDSK